jgi:hypothetical protein
MCVVTSALLTSSSISSAQADIKGLEKDIRELEEAWDDFANGNSDPDSDLHLNEALAAVRRIKLEPTA